VPRFLFKFIPHQWHSLISCLIRCPRFALLVIDINKTFLLSSAQKEVQKQIGQQSWLLNKLRQMRWWGLLFQGFLPGSRNTKQKIKLLRD